jgi:hypothetical protein
LAPNQDPPPTDFFGGTGRCGADPKVVPCVASEPALTTVVLRVEWYFLRCHTVFTSCWVIVIFTLSTVSLKLIWPSGRSFSLDSDYIFTCFKSFTFYWRQFCL